MKTPDILKKSMKKLLLVSLLLLLLPCFTFGAGPPIAASKVKASPPTAASKVKASKVGVKSMKQTPKGLNQTMALKPAMKITAITFKTNASGDWTFLYDYKNTGFVTFAPHLLKFKSTQILKNGMRTPIHTVTYNVANAPGTKSNAHSPWYRCSNASKLMMEIIYKGKVLDKRTINVPPINVKITNLSSLNGKFKASLKNNTGYTAKVAVRIMSKSPLQGGDSMYRPGAETMVIVPASSSKTCTGVIGDKGQNTNLEVLFKDEKKCSGKGYSVLDTKALPAAAGSILSTSPKVKMLKKDLPKGVMQLKIRKAEIASFEISTDQTGKWFWAVTVKNTGTAVLSGQDLIVQGQKRSYPLSGQNNWTPASGSIVGPGDILPNQTKLIRVSWTRCCKTGELKIDLRDNVSNSILDTQTKIVLSLGGINPYQVDVRVKSIEWKDTSKNWQATLKNMTNYTTKVKVQGYHWKANTSTPILVGTSTITLGPNGENSSAWWYVPNVQHGDMLKIHKTYIMGDCNESKNDCGFKGSNNIIIPDSFGI